MGQKSPTALNEPFVEVSESKVLVQAGWDHAPHLTESAKRQLLASTPPYLRDARSKGEPSLGSGAIYPIPISEVRCDPFAIPAHWPKAFALDVGWNKTAAVWGALDQSCDCLYVFTEHYRGQAEPSIHATSIRARGEWVPGVVDPASRGRSQRDGEQLLNDYQNLGLNLTPAQNSVEAGIYQVWERFSTGRLKIFSTCQNLWSEYRLYRRDENGKIVKKHDHLMDALRYLVVSGIHVLSVEPIGDDQAHGAESADEDTGY